MNHKKLRRVLISLMLVSCVLILVGPARGSGYYLIYQCADVCLSSEGFTPGCSPGGPYYANQQDTCVAQSDWDHCVSYCLLDYCGHQTEPYCMNHEQCSAALMEQLGWTCEW